MNKEISKISRERRNKKFRERYRSDEEFRQKHLEYNRQYRLAHPKPRKERRDKTQNKTYDIKAYQREYVRTHREQINAYMKKYLKERRLRQQKNDAKRTS